MDNISDLKEILSSVQEFTKNCDEKANSLFTATGIIFGLSSFLIETLSKKSDEAQIITIIVLGSLYLLTFLAILVCFCFIVFSRRKNYKVSKPYYQFYNEDIYKKSKENDFSAFIITIPTRESLEDQIKICSRIAHKKENFLLALACLEILLGTLLVSLMVLAFI